MGTANNIIVATYLLYLLISVALTIWVARTLHKRGAIFLIDAFHGNAELADSVNHLLVVGFYLINIGFVSLALKTAAIIDTSRAAIELLSDKMGMVLLILGRGFERSDSAVRAAGAKAQIVLVRFTACP